MNKPMAQGAALAAAVAALFAGSSALAQPKGDKPKEGAKMVHCGGINACKGKGACKGATNSCKGKNTCKGQGWAPAKDAQECKDKGGTVAS